MTFKIPAGVFAQHIIALGKTRSGKSSALRVLVESLLDADKPVCIIDPKGDWFGIKSSASGKQAGYPLVIFGGEHADVPINEHSGPAVAELIATGNRSCLIDLGGWMVGERTRFFIGFASTLFKLSKGRKHLVIDEVHNFAPQGKIFNPDAGKMLHWANRLASEGLGKGIALLAASQRPQKVAKDFLTSCETLIAKQVIHKLDREAIKDWIDGCADPLKGKEVIATLAQLKKPQAWIWSPEIDYGPVLVEFPMFKTFDSFKPPEEDAKPLSGWASVDLDVVKAKLAKVIEEVQANDPAALKKRIAELERQAKTAPSADIDAKKWERDIASSYETGHAEGRARGWKDCAELARPYLSNLIKGHEGFVADVEHIVKLVMSTPKFDGAQASAVAPQPRHGTGVVTRVKAPGKYPVTTRDKPTNGDGSAELGAGGKRRILAALAQYREGMNQRKLSILVDIAPKGGTWRTYMAELRGKGWVDGGKDHMRITDAGLEALGSYEPLPTGDELVQYWRNRLGDSGKRAIFDAVVEAYPGSIDVDEVSRITGIARAGGTWRTYMAELRGLGIIEGRGELQASKDLF